MGNSISLKIPEYDDYSAFYDSRFLPEVTYWADDFQREMTLDEYALGRLLAQQSGEILERIIVLDGNPIGTITARDFVTQKCQCTLGIVIAKPEYWGHGYGYDALKLFGCVMADKGIGRVILETYANNKRAQRCFMKFGFQKRRVFFAPNMGRFVVQMIMNLPPNRVIGKVYQRGDAGWKPPKQNH